MTEEEESREIPSYNIDYAYSENNQQEEDVVEETVDASFGDFVEGMKTRILQIVERKEYSNEVWQKTIEEYKAKLSALLAEKQKELRERLATVLTVEQTVKDLKSILESVISESKTKNEVFDKIVEDYRQAISKAVQAEQKYHELYVKLVEDNAKLNEDKITFNKSQVEFQKRVNEFNRLRGSGMV